MRRRKSPEEVEAPEVAEEISEQDTSAWHLYRSNELIKVGEYRDGTVLIKRENGAIEEIAFDELTAKYEPVKGLHKRGAF